MQQSVIHKIITLNPELQAVSKNLDCGQTMALCTLNDSEPQTMVRSEY